MKRKISYPFMLLLFSMLAHELHAQQKGKTSRVLSMVRNKTDNSPTSITFAPGQKLSAKNAQKIFQEYLGLDPSYVSMKLTNTTTTKQGIQVSRYAEYINDIKVEFSSYSLMSKNGQAQYMTGNYYHVTKNPSVKHKLTEKPALEAALKKTGAETYMWQVQGMEQNLKKQTKDPNATYTPQGTLVWMEDRSGVAPDRKLHLAYAFNIYAMKPLSRNMVYVDANTGKILFVNKLLLHAGTPATAHTAYSGEVGITTTLFEDMYYLVDDTRGGGINTYNMNNTGGETVTHFTNGSATWSSEVGLDAHWGAENVYDYWLSQQGRNSFDDAGATINSYVHVLENYNNAFWDGSAMYYGDGTGIGAGGFDPLTSQDVCAHEIGHAICQYTAGLIYAGESGAMNEGFSDIWGAVVENWADPHEVDAKAKNVWAIGEEIGFNPLRRMDTPSLRGDPNTYNGTNWVNTVGCSPGEINDQCGVHTNSGVLNHWFYFLSQGGTGTNEFGNDYSVSGVGINTAATIAYNTELALSSTADYALCRTTSINMAVLIYGPCSPEEQAVRNAWYAVGVFSSEDASAGAGAITGLDAACVGSTLLLSPTMPGGSWISQHPTVATVNSSGVVTGVSGGEVTIFYYVMGSCGPVSAGSAITIIAAPTDISASPDSISICPGTQTALKIVSPGVIPIVTQDFNSGLGSWSIDNTGNMSVHPMSPWNIHPDGYTDEVGEWHSPDASSFVQTNSDIGGGDGVVRTQLISPVFSLAGAANSVLTFQHVYSQYSSDINVEIDISTDGGSSWSLLHDYWGNGTGDVATFSNATVDLSAYDGMSNLRIRYYYYSDYGWYWALDNIIIGTSAPVAQLATWSPTTDLFTDAGLTTAYMGGDVDSIFAAPSSDITYTGTVTNIFGCTASRTSFVSVNSANPITGTASICVGSTTGLTTGAASGTWSSSNTAIASVDASTGIVTGVAAGNAYITYTACPGFFSTRQVTINAMPAPVTILGLSTICEGTTITLSNATGGGTWSSSDVSVATIGTYSGYLNGVTAGTATITYTQYTGCYTTRVQTVNTVPVAITGTLVVCAGSPTILSNATAGGTWISSHTSTATVDALSGTVTGVIGGLTTITYRMPSGCYRTTVVTVNNLPATIGGTPTICEGGSTTLTNSTTGGTWSSLATGTATIGITTGITTGVAAGMATISYTLSTGCARTKEVTVNAVPPVISGSASMCVGATTALTNASAGGTWMSSNTAKATVGGTTGIVTGVSTGTANITYTVAGAGCYRVQQVTVNAAPAVITGTTSVCIGSATTLNHATPGGTWTSSNTAIATVDIATGEVTGIAYGGAYITYTVSPGCFKTVVISVQNLPTAITTSGMVCEGATLGLSSMPTGGTWTSGTPATATIMTATGVLSGVTAGTTLVSYIASPGCMTTREIMVNAKPTAITGTPAVCVGSTTTLNGTPAGGTWLSSTTAKATVNPGTGVVSGVSTGSTTITYTLSSGCRRTTMVTVGTLPSAISGTLTLCTGSTTTLSSTPAGGTWISATAAATVGTGAGLVTGVGTGTSVISYTQSGCTRTATVTVNAALPSIGGDPIVCVGNSTALSNATTGGTWASSLTTKATVNVSNGVVTGVASGNSTITYRTTPTCYTTVQATVNGTVAAITGINSVCAGMTTTLSIAASGGAWSSNNVAKATIDAMTGVVTGVTTGSATISYIQSTGCYKTIAVAVYALPAAIGGTATVCEGSTTTLSNVTGGGTWSSGSTMATIATPASGAVTGVSAGYATITYRLSTGCYATRAVTVNERPSAISGATPICAGTVNEYTSTPSGGTWISSTATVATVGSSSGMVTGLISGGTILTYTLSTGCRRTQAIAVNPQPAAITGIAVVNAGATTTLATTTTGGTWSSSITEIATVGTSGIVTGIAAGNTTITYQLTSTGCYRTRTVTVNAILAGKSAVAESTPTEVRYAVFSVYPNPTTGSFTLSSDVNGVFTVFTLEGKQVEQYTVTTTAATLSLPRSLAAGVYMCRFAGDNGSSKIVRLVYQP